MNEAEKFLKNYYNEQAPKPTPKPSATQPHIHPNMQSYRMPEPQMEPSNHSYVDRMPEPQMEPSNHSFVDRMPEPQMKPSNHSYVEVQRMVGMGEAWCRFWSTWNFHGRASRSEFWFLALWVFILNFILMLIFPLLSSILNLICLIPSICLQVRRLHDINLSGWFWFLNFIPFVGTFIVLVLMCIPSTKGNNTYGPMPNIIEE